MFAYLREICWKGPKAKTIYWWSRGLFCFHSDRSPTQFPLVNRKYIDPIRGPHFPATAMLDYIPLRVSHSWRCVDFSLKALHHKDSAARSTRHLVEMQESAAQTLRILLEHGAVLSGGLKPPWVSEGRNACIPNSGDSGDVFFPKGCESGWNLMKWEV